MVKMKPGPRSGAHGRARRTPARSLVKALVLAGAGVLLAAPAAAQESYPSRPIRLVVPLTAGGPGDALARAIAPPLARILNVPVVVENRGGAGGTLGIGYVAKAAPDGYTIGLASAGTQSINPFIYSKLPYDARKDFEPISPIASYVNVAMCNPAVPANTMGELVAYAKANPGKVTFASGGTGTSAHLAMEVVRHISGAPLQHVAYRGGAQAMTDVIGGQVSCLFDVLVTALPQIKGGHVKALAVSGEKRSPYAPAIPTMAESGLPGFEEASGQLWLGLVAPARTPKAVVDKLNAAVQEVLRDDAATRKVLEVQGFDPMPMPAAQFEQYLQKDYDSWGRIVKLTGAKAD